jgi:DNA-binding Lrp family transcriptional regulator
MNSQESLGVTSLDELRLLRALQVAPRASFARLGDVLGLSEQAVARRYRKLRGEGVLRIFGVLNPAVSGQHIWHVRVRCRPSGVVAVAEALAKRDDVAWVALNTTGSEVLFSIRSLWADEREALFSQMLPRATQVLDVHAAVVLHMFRGMDSDDWGGLASLMSAAETDALQELGALTEPTTPLRPGAFELEPHDDAIIAALARDGRASYAQLASAAGISEGRAARRLANLMGAGALRIDMDLAATALGMNATVRFRCRVHPGMLQRAGDALASLPEVSFAAATTGVDNLYAAAECRDLAEVYKLLTNEIGAIEGIGDVEVVPVGRIVKQSGALVIGGRLVDPSPQRARAVSAASRR